MTRPDAHFDDENDAVEYIRLRLAETLPEHLAGAVAGQFEVYCGLDTPLNEWPGSESLDTTSDGPFEVDIGAPFLGPWTVREQDLGDVGTIAALVAGFSLSEPGRRLDPIVQLTMAAVCMLWRLKRRGVSISPLQRDVLIAIRRRGAVSSETLASDARAMSAEWSRADVEAALQELGAIRLNNGTVVALVHKGEDGLWSTDARGLWEVPFGAFG